MGLIVTPEEEITAYFASDAISQSDLKKGLEGIDAMVAEKEDISNKPFIIIGKAVDMLLTGDEEEFSKNFYISNITKKPTDAVALIIEKTYEMVAEDYEEYLQVCHAPLNEFTEVTHEEEVVVVPQETLEEVEEIKVTSFVDYIQSLDKWQAYIIGCARETGWNARYGDEALIKNLVTEETSIYFNDLSKSFGMKVLDIPTYENIKRIVESLKTNLRTAKYFDRYEQKQYTHIDVILQIPIYFEYRSMNCKALLDMVIVVRDSDEKILRIRPFDLKTMSGNTFNFPQSIRSRRYDIQAEWYTMALADYYAVSEIGGIIAPFEFIVESTTKQGKPLVFEVSKELSDIARVGRDAMYYCQADAFGHITQTQHIACPAILGIEQLIDLKQYHDLNGYDAEIEVHCADAVEEPLLVGWNGYVSRPTVEVGEEVTFNFDEPAIIGEINATFTESKSVTTEEDIKETSSDE